MTDKPSKKTLLVILVPVLLSLVALGLLILSYRVQLDIEQKNRELEAKVAGLQSDQLKSKQELDHRRSELRAAQKDLSAERAIPKGSLQTFHGAYRTTARDLRFDVVVVIEYVQAWKLRQEPPAGRRPFDQAKYDRNGKVFFRELTPLTRSKNRSDPLQGITLGQRSNFVFGIFMLGDFDPVLHCPSQVFEAPKPAYIFDPDRGRIRNYFSNPDPISYKKAAPLKRILKVEVVRRGIHQETQPLEATVVSILRENKRGFTMLAFGVGVDEDGIVPGPPYVADSDLWRSTKATSVYPISAPNDGIGLMVLNIDEAYRLDKQLRPKENENYFYGKPGWSRLGWDGTANRIDVLFEPLKGGPQEERSPVLHSLIFQLPERRACFFPFWAIKESLLSPPELNLADIPTLNVKTMKWTPELGVPMRQDSKWRPKDMRQALDGILRAQTAISAE